jgi:hypothetical protein
VGLDITFYEKVERVGDHATSWLENGEEMSCYDLDHQRAYIWPEGTFLCTQRGLDKEFCYISRGRTASWHASYSGYSIFRAALMGMVRPDLLRKDDEPGYKSETGFYPRLWDITDDAEFRAIPFIELLDFADNEGVFTGEVAAKLLHDFEVWLPEAERPDFGQYFPAWQDHMLGKYLEYMEGLRLVSLDGLVDYH